MSLFKIHATSADFKKRPTDRHFCTIGTTNAVLNDFPCGGTFLVKDGNTPAQLLYKQFGFVAFQV